MCTSSSNHATMQPGFRDRYYSRISWTLATVAPAVTLATLAPLLFATRTLAAQPELSVSPGQRPAHFPHRIWAACDFEGQTPDYGWFGRSETNEVPRYAGNRTALAADSGPYRSFSAVMTGVNPVPG